MKKFNKRMMALLVAFIMLLNLCPSVLVSAQEVSAEEFIPENSTEIGDSTEAEDSTTSTETSNFSFETAKEIYLDQTEIANIPESNQRAYFSFTPAVSGTYKFTSFATGNTYVYLYDSDYNMITSDDDNGDANNFLITYYLEAEKTYYFAAFYLDEYATGSFSVILTKVMGVKSISVSPVNIIENTCGYFMGDYDENNLYVNYFYYQWWNKLSYTVTLEDERTIEGNGNNCFDHETGVQYNIMARDNQWAGNPWVLGNTYTPTISVAGYETTVSVAITESPVQSVVISPIRIVENTRGHLGGGWSEELEEYINYYRYNWYNEISYTVTFNSGYQTSGIGSYFYDEYGYGYNINSADNQSAMNPWLVGNTYYPTASVAGIIVTVPVTIIESPIENIQFDPINIIENTNGSYEGDWNENGEYVEYYRYELYQIPLSYTVTYKNGIQERHEGYNFFDQSNYRYDIGWYDPQSSSNPWLAGQTYYPVVSVGGKEISVPVTIIESPIESISADPIYLNSETDRSQNEYCDENNCYSYTYYNWTNKCVLNITLKDGTTQTLTNNRFEYNGESYSIEYCDEQNPHNLWEVGGTYTATVKLLGKSTDVEITILEQKTSNGIRYILQNDCAIIVGLSDCDDSITIPQYIDDYPVVAITSLSGGEYREIIIPDYISSISTEMLDDCYGLERIVIGSGITALNNRTFMNAYDLKEIVVSEDNAEYASVDGILYDKEITRMVAIPVGKNTDHLVPETANNIELYINGTYNFKINLQNDASGYIKEDGVLYNKEKTVIYSCDPDKSGDYKMPDTVKSISNCAFKGSNLESVTVSQNVSEIVYYAFAESGNLKQVVLPENLNAISTHAFANCVSLTDVELPSKLAILESGAFANTDIKSITIPSGVKDIESTAFINSRLEEVIFSEGVETIGASAFEGTNLKDVKLPESLKIIDGCAFFGSTLESIELNDGLETICGSAFAHTELTEISIPGSVTYIGVDAFADSNIQDINLAEGITQINEYAFSRLGIETLNLPKTVTDIAYKSFENCYNLTNIDLPDNIQRLDATAFDGTAWYNNQPEGLVYLENALYSYKGILPEDSVVDLEDDTKIIAGYAFAEQYNLRTLNLPKSVKNIGACAFIDCYGLTDVYYAGSESDRAKIEIGEYNFLLENATWHYTYDYDNPDCQHEYTNNCDTMCNSCGKTRIPTHYYENGVCKVCRARLESDHDYANNSDLSWVVSDENSESITITFSESTFVEEDWDFIYIYDSENNEFGKYTGSELSGKTITVPGNTITIRLCTDRIGTEYGFRVTRVVYNCAHSYGNNGCIHCGAYLESEHHYPNLFDKTWEIYRKNALSITLDFSSETFLEDGWDFIYIYDGEGNEIGKYTGAELASRSITVLGDTVKIRLCTDRIGTEYGFRVTSIFAEYTGDVNGDCVVNAEDLVYIRSLLLSGTEDNCFDINKDGKSDIKDIVRLKKILADM